MPSVYTVALHRRALDEWSPYALGLLLHGWQPAVYGVGALMKSSPKAGFCCSLVLMILILSEQSRRNTAVQFLGMTQAEQLALLQLRVHPVYKFVPPPKAIE